MHELLKDSFQICTVQNVAFTLRREEPHGEDVMFGQPQIVLDVAL